MRIDSFRGHDPSGIDMTRDNDDRVSLFSRSYVDVRRIALNMDQVQEYDPPPNPTKIKDSRSSKYISRFGSTSWELDALEPRVIEKLIKDEVNPLIDWNIWNETYQKEEVVKQELRELYTLWKEKN